MDRHPHKKKQYVPNHPQAQPQQAPPQGNTSVAYNPPPEDEEEYGLPHEVQTILSWHASGRPFRQRTFEFFLNSFLITLAVEIILFLFSQYLLMLVVFSFVFLSFALAVVPPRPFYYKITTEGIRIEDHVFIWEELYDFYFMRQLDQNVLHIRSKAFFPGEIIMTLGDISQDQVKAALLPYLPYREYVQPSFMDRASDWLEQNFPLERKIS